MVHFILANESSFDFLRSLAKWVRRPNFTASKAICWYGRDPAHFPQNYQKPSCRIQVFIFSRSFLFHHCQEICFCRRGNKNPTYGYFPTQTHLLAREPLWWPQNLTKENPNQVYYWASSINPQLGAAVCSWSGNKSALFYLSQIHLNSKGPHLNQEFLFFWKCHFIWISSSVV